MEILRIKAWRLGLGPALGPALGLALGLGRARGRAARERGLEPRL